jgi:hypothetical protein
MNKKGNVARNVPLVVDDLLNEWGLSLEEALESEEFMKIFPLLILTTLVYSFQCWEEKLEMTS